MSTKAKDCAGAPVIGEKRNRGSVAGAFRKGDCIFMRGMIKETGIENNK
jgi:hypothetical protein